ncbi:MAG TPA: hypothetical protein VMZ03_14105 [Chitinophagaceae bacterium]|nr:hypothetical protein [Chitinophagaceae bacterium]
MAVLKPLFVTTISIFSLLHLSAQNAAISCPANMIVKADAGKEGAVVSFPSLAGDMANATYTPASGSFLRLGSHSVIVTTAAGQKCSFTVMVTDNEAPYVSQLTLNRERLWPANDKLKRVSVNYYVSDNAGAVKTSLTIASNATDGVKDYEIIDNNAMRLKASRLPDGTPRIYIITVTAMDNAGNKTVRTTSISVSETMTAISGM